VNIQLGPAGEKMIEQVKDSLQQWTGSDTFQASNFAGQLMQVMEKSDEESYLFELHYLGYKLIDIVGIDQAKSLAPAFAKKVLAELSEQIF
jgi:hypothetical protein